MLHPNETQRIRDLAKGDHSKEARLAIAACALVRCSAEYPIGSAEYDYWKAIETAGSQAEYAFERNLLVQQTGTVGTRDQVIYPMFQYGAANRTWDAIVRTDNAYGISTRTLGAIQAVGGATSAVAGTGMTAVGGASCPETGVGCLVAAGGVLVTGWGLDQGRAGVATVLEGRQQPTFGGSLISSTLGISPEAGELVYGLVGLSPAAAEAVLVANTTNQTARLNAMSRASYADFAPQGIKPTPDVMANPHVQAMMAEARLASPTATSTDIQRRVTEWLESGRTMPTPATAQPSSILIKIVPKGDQVSPYSPYWFTPEQARAIARMTPEQVGQVLGLPASQAARIINGGADYYAITPRAGATPRVFVSDIAPTTQGAYVTAPNAEQVIVPNRTLWNVPMQIDPITLRAVKP